MFKIDIKRSIVLLLLSIPNSVLNIGLLYIINRFLTADIESLPGYLVPVFFSLLIYSYFLGVLFQTKLVHYTFTKVYENETRILKILHDAPLIKFEQYGPSRFYSILEDLRTFILLPGVMSAVFNALLTILICLSYLYWISPKTTLILNFFIVLLVGLYLLINRRLARKFESLRRMNDDYYKYIEDSIRGFKELKISRLKTHNFFTRHLSPNRESAKKMDIDITSNYAVISLISQYGLYILLGLVLYFLTWWRVLDQKETITYVMALLFLNAPVNSLVSMQGIYTRLIVANKRVKEFFRDFDGERALAREPSVEASYTDDYTSLSLRNISFRYNEDEKNSFVLNGIDFSVKKGEVIFIVGGNGSGKSTFVNIITGLYQPAEGEINMNGRTVDSSSAAYQDHFSVIYTENHLFSRNYENYSLEGNERYQQLLRLLEMDTVIGNDREDSVRRKFSKGQSKRMSLIFALLENKPILVLDEWAADQDPHFRKYFYEQLVPRLKKEGKTIVAVTHDDAYFRQADRVIKFDYGRIVKDINVKEQPIADLI